MGFRKCIWWMLKYRMWKEIGANVLYCLWMDNYWRQIVISQCNVGQTSNYLQFTYFWLGPQDNHLMMTEAFYCHPNIKAVLCRGKCYCVPKARSQHFFCHHWGSACPVNQTQGLDERVWCQFYTSNCLMDQLSYVIRRTYGTGWNICIFQMVQGPSAIHMNIQRHFTILDQSN